MSVYYNLFKQNNEMKLLDPVKFSEVAYQPILKNQGDYLVGVKRFKIPSQGIDAFRIYPNRYYLGMCLPTNANRLDNTYGAVFDLTTGATSTNLQGMPLDREQGENYIPINSNVRFCEVMNRTIAQSFMGCFNMANNNSLTRNGNTNTITVPTATSGAPSTTGTAIELCSPSGTGNIGYIDTSNIIGSTYMGYEFSINSISNIQAGGEERMLSSLLVHFEVPIGGKTGAPTQHFVPLFSNVGANLNIGDFNTIFPHGICVCSYGKIPISALSFIDRNTRFTEKLFVSPEGNGDLEYLLGRYVNNFSSNSSNNGISPTVYLRLQNNTTNNIVIDKQFDLTYDFNLYTSNNYYFGERLEIDTVNVNNTLNENVGQLSPVPTGFPTFSVDDDDKISLTIPEYLYCGSNSAVYMSNGLASLLNLSVGSVEGLTLTDFTASSPCAVNISKSLGILGGVATMNAVSTDAEMGSFITSSNLNRSQTNSSKIVITESKSSNYKRSYLWGLQIRSNNLSTSGEFVSGGRSFQKVLTDFVIDPSTNQGDYLLFEPESGGQRFYPLNASGELRQLDVSVYIVDMNNNTSVLNLPPNTSLSLKIEFRPKNMVYNYIDNSTMS